MFVILPQTFWLCYFFLTIFDDWVESLLFSLLHKAVYTVAQSIFNVISPHVLLSRGVQTCPGQPCLHISIHSPLPQTSLSSVHASHVLKQESFYSDLTFNNPFFFFLILALTGVSLELEVLIYYVYPLSDWALDHRFCCLYSLYWVPRVP